MTPQQLKNAILQLAIQGKLVEQRAEEGTGQELFEAIQEEKQKLVEEGKLKKQKALSQITADEIPFEIPETWKWARLGEIGFTNIGLTYKPTDISNDGTIVLRSSNIQNGKLDFSDIVRVKKDISEAKMCQVGDILICARNGSKKLVGKAALINLEGMSFGAFMAVYRSICNGYVLHFINSAYFRNALLPETGTTTINQLTQDSLKNCVIPLPPLAEQKRIVEKIEELLPLVDRYEKAWTRLEELNKKFPLDMQKAILQEAIQGKLVEQRKEEGTGEELFKEIQEEKKKLLEEGKLKKQKAIPDITEDEIPFDIPETWKWVRFDELGIYKKGPFGSDLTKDKFVPKGENTIKVYEQKNAIKKDATLGEYYITKDYFLNKLSGFSVEPGDIIVSCAGTIGETFIMPDNIEKGVINQALMRMKLFKSIYVEYFLLYFDYVLKKNAKENSKGSAIKNIPPFAILKNYLVPLPPLAEQKRIVEKIEQLLSLCEKLK